MTQHTITRYRTPQHTTASQATPCHATAQYTMATAEPTTSKLTPNKPTDSATIAEVIIKLSDF